MNDTGYNPMRWNCQNKGCFNAKRRPKIELFSDLLPGRIAFGDIDGIVEISGNVLILEWKSDRNDLPKGQQIMYSRITRSSPVSVIILVGDAETMDVSAMGSFFRGVYQEPSETTMDVVRDAISSWVSCAQLHPVTSVYSTDISEASWPT